MEGMPIYGISLFWPEHVLSAAIGKGKLIKHDDKTT